MNKLTDVAD